MCLCVSVCVCGGGGGGVGCLRPCMRSVCKGICV